MSKHEEYFVLTSVSHNYTADRKHPICSCSLDKLSNDEVEILKVAETKFRGHKQSEKKSVFGSDKNFSITFDIVSCKDLPQLTAEDHKTLQENYRLLSDCYGKNRKSGKGLSLVAPSAGVDKIKFCFDDVSHIVANANEVEWQKEQAVKFCAENEDAVFYVGWSILRCSYDNSLSFDELAKNRTIRVFNHLGRLRLDGLPILVKTENIPLLATRTCYNGEGELVLFSEGFLSQNDMAEAKICTNKFIIPATKSDVQTAKKCLALPADSNANIREIQEKMIACSSAAYEIRSPRYFQSVPQETPGAMKTKSKGGRPRTGQGDWVRKQFRNGLTPAKILDSWDEKKESDRKKIDEKKYHPFVPPSIKDEEERKKARKKSIAKIEKLRPK